MPMINKNRLLVVIAVIIFFMLMIVGKLFYLQVLKHHVFSDMSQGQTQKVIQLYAKRGRIFDRNGVPLAMSRPAYSIYAVPHKIKDKLEFSKKVGAILGKTTAAISSIIQSESPFVWLKRKASVEMKEQLASLELNGMNFIYEEKRVYPNQELAADLLGFVGTDGGLEGLEYVYNSQLSGSKGTVFIDGDPSGKSMVNSNRDVQGSPTGFTWGAAGLRAESFDGQHVHTSIDEYIQYIAQKHLDAAVEKTGAKSGSAIVMDPYNGDILAMVDSPAFNPNEYWKYPSSVRKNSAIVDIFEPGSVFKLLTLATYLEVMEGSDITDIIDVPETIEIAGRTIQEAHERKEGESSEKTVGQIVQESLNVGTTKLALQIGEEKMDEYIRKFGFGQRYGIGLPGESPGIYRARETWSQVDIAMLSFGQGIAVTTLQLAAMVAVFANGGDLVKPRIVKYLSDHEQVSVHGVPKMVLNQVVSERTAALVREVMTSVVDGGTGMIVRNRRFSMAGKTGTAQKAKDTGGYSETDYVASFVGMMPAINPKVVIVVSVDSPETSIWGSTVAGPVFRNISSDLINYLNLSPDR